MNLMKGNINFTNELIDNCTSREQLRDNETLIELMKALKQMEPKLIKLCEEFENEDVLAVCLLVNEDLHTTFARFKAIKEGKTAEEFVPSESKTKVFYLNPTHLYQRQLSSINNGSGGPKANPAG